MAKNFRIDSSGLERKIRTLALLDQVAQFLVEDAAAFIQDRLQDRVLNGPPGSDYPKIGYPTGVGAEGGYVGRDTGFLAGSVEFRKFEEYGQEVYINPTQVKDYYEAVAKWARQKYGADYMEITEVLYGPKVIDSVIKELQRFFRQASKGTKYQYRNPFPA